MRSSGKGTAARFAPLRPCQRPRWPEPHHQTLPTGIPPATGVRSPTPHSPRARRHRNSNAARERPLRSSLLVGRNGEVACPRGSIVSHSATSICEQRNPFQSPCDPLLTVPVLRSYLPNGLSSVGNSMPSASNGPLPRQLGARPSPSRDGKVAVSQRERSLNPPSPWPPCDRVSLANRVPKGCATGPRSRSTTARFTPPEEGRARHRHSPRHGLPPGSPRPTTSVGRRARSDADGAPLEFRGDPAARHPSSRLGG